jgi:hypothetical protein
MTAPNLRQVVAAAVAVSIVTARKNNEHPTPRDGASKEPIIAAHTAKVLRQLGIPEEANPIKSHHVDQEMATRGGWGTGASLTRLTYVASCFQCSEIEGTRIVEEFTVPGARKAYLLDHAEAHPDHIVARWEQP